ncbi:RING-H2 finger protein [Musa troglodytarum]|uniref:RING-H2 finger protein n=1 Tax=Musa troglodytarum TaxID=320322 RepID=A0A9E7EIQ5_9LILI|nr:RING-H2 finger protein [Musa troglodytarum]
MRSLAKFLQSSEPLRQAESPAPLPTVDSDVVVILAALLCAVICVVGLALIARCAAPAPSSPPCKGLKKKALRALSTLSFDSSAAVVGCVRLVDCAICLAEFADGDEVRVLPQCGHGFHAGCVDTWLLSHSSCPSCRRVLVVPAPPSRCSANSSDGVRAPDAKAAECGSVSALSP